MKKYLLLLVSALFSYTSFAEPIKLAGNLSLDAERSRQQNRPLVVFFTNHDCPYCEILRAEQFQFLSNDKRFILREIELDSGNQVTDFDGKTRDHGQFARRYAVSLTPTVAFIGPEGQQLADPIVGVLTLDFYSYYFDKAVAQATDRLRDASANDTQ